MSTYTTRIFTHGATTAAKRREAWRVIEVIRAEYQGPTWPFRATSRAGRPCVAISSGHADQHRARVRAVLHLTRGIEIESNLVGARAMAAEGR